MTRKNENARIGNCTPKKGVSLTVLKAGRTAPHKKSRMGRRRAAVLILVNLLIVLHILQWAITGRTLSPIEPSESMYLVGRGEVNAGAIFFAIALLATVVFGRFFCGWGCHLVALQDLCAWMMKKVRIRPQPFRSRFLYHAPLVLAIYMFVWPAVVLWWYKQFPPLQNRIMTTEYWATFPGPGMAVVTFLLCGFVIVYLLGSKAFCTYGCPYGGFFAPLDKLSPTRIRVTDDCEHCGHCTAACTSNVRIHEEVKAFGMVVDPGCMKCLDCVSVCPNDALYVGVGKPSIGAKPASPTRAAHYDFTLAEEFVVLGVGLAMIFVYRSLYDAVPLLLTMGIAAMIGFGAVKTLRLFTRPHVKLQNLQLKKSGRITRAGYLFASSAAAVAAFSLHSAFVQYHAKRAAALAPMHDDRIWISGNDWWSTQPEDIQQNTMAAIGHFETAMSWGLFDQPRLMQELVILYLARGDVAAAERTTRQRALKFPNLAESHIQLASVLQTAGKYTESEQSMELALKIDPCSAVAREKLASVYEATGRVAMAIALYDEARQHVCEHNDRWLFQKAELLARTGSTSEAIAMLDQILKDYPDSVQAHYRMGALLMSPPAPDVSGAAIHFQRTIELAPDFADGHYNLAVARFSARRFDEAEAHIRTSIQLDPEDPQKYAFLSVVLTQLGKTKEAAEASKKANELATQQRP
ncbi:MAG: tetratricopeptide repeat protein [Planctomycetota bacterium]|jgi:polyferredoxin/Flp pilus assembly protein TadD